MPAYHTGAEFRYEEPVRFQVLSGTVTATDSDGTQALSEGATYRSPEKGGTLVRVISSARVAASSYEEPTISEEIKEPTRDELRAEAKALGLKGYANLPKKKLANLVAKAGA